MAIERKNDPLPEIRGGMKMIHQPCKNGREGTIPDLAGRDYPREELARILSAYNGRDVGKIEKAVVTGQQLGFMTGPIYTVLKGISCILLARELGATPIFWLATEDHDVGEIDHTYLLGSDGNLNKYRLSLPKEGYFVEDLKLSESDLEVINRFFADSGIEPLPVYPESYSKTMTGFLKHLFRGTELLFIEPRSLRSLAGSFFERELEGDLNLFYKNDEGKRKKVESRDSVASLSFDRLSTNVSSRPVMQSSVIPTIAYVAGPNEIEYYRELEELHQSHSVPMPLLVPRLQAAFITHEAMATLEKCGLDPAEPIPSSWEEIFPEIAFMDKQERKAAIEEKGLGYSDLHQLHNLLMPKERPQERVLNWFGFQGMTDENLVQRLIDENHISGRLFCKL